MFSVILPTFNRAGILERSLPVIMAMAGMDQGEVIVIDDGSTDTTDKILSEYQQRYSPTLRVLRQPNQGPAAARNAGIQASAHERVLFVDDDVFPDPNMLFAHATLLDNGFDVSQGLLHWHPDIRPDRLLQFIDRHGSQFAFHRIRDDLNLDFRYIYSGNLAVRKELLIACGGFDPGFDFSAFEDTALAYKMKKTGARIGFNRHALAYHLHPMNEVHFLERLYKVGFAAGLLDEKYPEIARALKLHRKTTAIRSQAVLWHWLIKPGRFWQLAGYNVYMRLRSQEAFRRGLRDYFRARRRQDRTGGPSTDA